MKVQSKINSFALQTFTAFTEIQSWIEQITLGEYMTNTSLVNQLNIEVLKTKIEQKGPARQAGRFTIWPLGGSITTRIDGNDKI